MTARGGRCFLCFNGLIPDGMVCSAGPEGCGYCTGRRCDHPVPKGAQDWMVDVDGTVVWPDDGEN